MYKTAIKMSMIAFFISVAGVIYELYSFNWAATFWALWSAIMAILWFSMLTVLDEDLPPYPNYQDYADNEYTVDN